MSVGVELPVNVAKRKRAVPRQRGGSRARIMTRGMITARGAREGRLAPRARAARSRVDLRVKGQAAAVVALGLAMAALAPSGRDQIAVAGKRLIRYSTHLHETPGGVSRSLRDGEKPFRDSHRARPHDTCGGEMNELYKGHYICSSAEPVPGSSEWKPTVEVYWAEGPFDFMKRWMDTSSGTIARQRN
jgi:hypothetical protein